jgi:hypothetical protein
MPILRNAAVKRRPMHHNMQLATPTYQGMGSLGASNRYPAQIPGHVQQQASQSSLTMGYQTPTQAINTKVMAILTADEVAMYKALTDKVTAAMTQDEMDILASNTAEMLAGAGVLTPSQFIEDMQDNLALNGVAIPPEGIQPGYNALDHELAVQLVADWIERGSIVEDELNGDDAGKRTFLNMQDTVTSPGNIDRHLSTKQLRPRIRIKPLYMDSANVNELIEGPIKQTGTSLLPSLPHVSALLAGCTMRKADGWAITDGLVEWIVTIEDVEAYNNPQPMVGQNIVGTTNILYQSMGYSHGLKGPPADEITGTSYAEVQKRQEAERRLNAEAIEFRHKMQIVLGKQKHSADLDAPEVRFTHPNGGTTSVAFRPRRVNPLTGVPNMLSEEVLAREAVKAMHRIKSNVQEMADKNHTTIGVHLDPPETPDDVGPEEMEPTLLVGTPAPAPGAAAAAPVPIHGLSAAALAYPNTPTGHAITSSGISSVPIASIPTSNTVTATYTGVVTTGSSTAAYVSPGISAYMQNPQWSGIGSLTDEDGDEIPTVRMRNLRPGFQYKGIDGTIIEVDATGNFTIKDDAARITYLATRVRNFNRFVNGSDLVGEFIEDLGRLGASQEQAAAADIEMFIRWLVHKAAEHDQEEAPADVPAVSAAEVSGQDLERAIIIDEAGARVRVDDVEAVLA